MVFSCDLVGAAQHLGELLVRSALSRVMSGVNMDNLIVILIVVLAGAYIVRTFYKRWKKRDGDVCGCSACDMNTSCSEFKKDQYVS